MKAKGLNALLVLSIVALAILAFSQHRTIRELADRAAAAAPDANQPRDGAAPAEPAVIPDSALTADHRPAAESSDRAGTPSQRVMRDIAKMFDNPQMNEVMKASQRATLEVLYKNLLDTWQLSPEERAH